MILLNAFTKGIRIAEIELCFSKTLFSGFLGPFERFG